jgi:hypothetical protein
VDLVAAVVAHEQPHEVREPGKVRSTTQRTVPSPEPCSVWRRGGQGHGQQPQQDSRHALGRVSGHRAKVEEAVETGREYVRTPAGSSTCPVRPWKAVLHSHRGVTNGVESCPRYEPATGWRASSGKLSHLTAPRSSRAVTRA